MLAIFICEDDSKQREHIEAIVRRHITMTGYQMELVLSTDNPREFLDYLETHPQSSGLYILDVNLQQKMDGITLAQKVRELDIRGKIIFVTSHAELFHLTFRYRVEALDYIVKNDLESIAKSVRECMEIAYQHYLNSTLQQACYQMKTGDSVRNIPLGEIMFFESHHISHKVILHTKNKRLEFYGALSDIEDTSPDFFRCHKSFLVNAKNIRHVNKASREIEMINGEIALVTAKKIKGLLETMAKSVL